MSLNSLRMYENYSITFQVNDMPSLSFLGSSFVQTFITFVSSMIAVDNGWISKDLRQDYLCILWRFDAPLYYFVLGCVFLGHLCMF